MGARWPVLMEVYWDNVENSFSWQVSWMTFVSVVAKKTKKKYSWKQGQDTELKKYTTFVSFLGQIMKESTGLSDQLLDEKVFHSISSPNGLDMYKITGVF